MTLSWSAKRQLVIVGLISICILIILGFYLYPKFVTAPTCTDGKQNGTEHGVDCGGTCPYACLFEANEIAIIWSRSFMSAPGYATAIAYIDNRNTNAAVQEIPYEFRLFDDEGRIVTRQGKTFIGPHGKTAIVEIMIPVGNRTPTRTTFDFLATPAWLTYNKVDMDKVTNAVSVRDIDFSNTDTVPKLSARLENDSFSDLADLDVVAIVYNTVGEALAVSKTHLSETVVKNSITPIYFTWPDPILEPIGRVEILPRINPFAIK